MLIVPEIRARLRKGRTALYEDQAAGLLPKFVKLGLRRVALPEREVDAILSARIAGRSEAELKALVKRLEAERQKLAILK